jgi:hypothetical protein
MLRELEGMAYEEIVMDCDGLSHRHRAISRIFRAREAIADEVAEASALARHVARQEVVDVTARVMSALEAEPTVMAPLSRRAPAWQRPLLALAASAAGVAVVAWLALTPDGGLPPTAAGGLAAARPGPAVALAQSTPRLQEYLVAHQAHAPGGVIGGAARNIRTVAANGDGR